MPSELFQIGEFVFQFGKFRQIREHPRMRRSSTDPSYALIRSQLRGMRRRAGLTQVELSLVLGFSHSEISKIENGERYIDMPLYFRWCRACEVEVMAAVQRLLDSGA
jgi:DNA-binding XRE family transcriptional regulator